MTRFYKAIDVSNVSQRHAAGICKLINGYHDPIAKRVILDTPMMGDVIRSTLKHLWAGVACCDPVKESEIRDDAR